MESTLGQRLKTLRKSLGLTQTMFGEPISLSQDQVSEYEKDRYKPNARILSELLDAYGVNAEWLEDGTGPMLSSASVTQTVNGSSNAVAGVNSVAKVVEQGELKKKIKELEQANKALEQDNNLLKSVLKKLSKD